MEALNAALEGAGGKLVREMNQLFCVRVWVYLRVVVVVVVIKCVCVLVFFFFF